MDYTEDDINRWGELGWNARFEGTNNPQWHEFDGPAKHVQLQAVRDAVRTMKATDEASEWYLRAICGEFDAVPMAVVVEKPGKKPAKKEK